MITQTRTFEQNVRECIEANYVPITDEGSVRLAEGILKQAYKEYVTSLMRVKKAWEAKEHKPSDRNIDNWILALRLKHKEEKFYYTELFSTLTLGLSAPGDDVVRRIQKKVKYEREIYEK